MAWNKYTCSQGKASSVHTYKQVFSVATEFFKTFFTMVHVHVFLTFGPCFLDFLPSKTFGPGVFNFFIMTFLSFVANVLF